MKKSIKFLIIILLSSVCICGALKPPQDPIPPCNTNLSFVMLSNVDIYGDPILGFFHWYSFDDAITAGCELTLTIKSTGYCHYTSTKTITNNNRLDLTGGSTINNVSIPLTRYDVSVKIVSPCVWDSWLGMNVRFVWTKTVDVYAITSNFDMGYGQKVACATGSGSGSGGGGNTNPGGTNTGGPGGPGIGGPGVDRYLAKCDEMGIMY